MSRGKSLCQAQGEGSFAARSCEEERSSDEAISWPRETTPQPAASLLLQDPHPAGSTNRLHPLLLPLPQAYAQGSFSIPALSLQSSTWYAFARGRCCSPGRCLCSPGTLAPSSLPPAERTPGPCLHFRAFWRLRQLPVLGRPVRANPWLISIQGWE